MPIEIQKLPTLSPPSLGLDAGHSLNGFNDLTVSRVASNLLRQLALQPDVRFRQAILADSFLRVSPGDAPSNNIADFRSIGCIFLWGGPEPPAGKSNAFAIENQWPEHWDQWKNQVVPRMALTDVGEIQWQKSQALMTVQKAEYLLKAAGYPQRYHGVVILKLGDRPLVYCFSKVDGLRNVNVDIATGRVSEVLDSTVSLWGGVFEPAS
ncbi:MAG: hypothetical protein Q9166_001362 [cf. Caloplaca sp. 2 TL-2023]